jgi:tetratricopeptide (TPR) repeat protein
MSTSKKKVTPEPSRPVQQPRSQHSQAFDDALVQYQRAVELVHRGDYAAARPIFAELETAHRGELQLAERCRTFGRICDQRLEPAQPEPQNDEERYQRAVHLCNEGRGAEALPLLEQCLRSDPTSVRCLYLRSVAFALEGQAEAAISGLRQAIAVEPKVRYQVANDTDFERIRENPAFIDLIEPTPAGA